MHFRIRFFEFSIMVVTRCCVSRFHCLDVTASFFEFQYPLSSVLLPWWMWMVFLLLFPICGCGFESKFSNERFASMNQKIKVLRLFDCGAAPYHDLGPIKYGFKILYISKVDTFFDLVVTSSLSFLFFPPSFLFFSSIFYTLDFSLYASVQK